jgi:cytochrome P450
VGFWISWCFWSFRQIGSKLMVTGSYTAPPMAKYPKYDLTSQVFHEGMNAQFTHMRKHGDVIPMRFPLFGNLHVALTYKTARDVLKNDALFCRQTENAGLKPSAEWRWWMPKSFKPLMHNMLVKDEPDHKRLRSLVDQAFTRRDVEGMRDEISGIADQLLDRLEGRETVDILETYTRELPMLVICTLLGIRPSDVNDIKYWIGGLVNARSIPSMLMSMPRVGKFLTHLRERFAQVRENPEPGLITGLVEAHQGDDQFTDDELLAMVFILFFAGHETTVHLMTGAILALIDHPHERQKLQNDWSKIGLAVEEFNRFVSPVMMTKLRYARQDLEIGGARLKRGQSVLALLASANHDPAQFPDPERLILDRLPNAQLGYGSGIHVCLGMQLARAEAQIGIEKLFQLYPDLKLAVRRSDVKWRRRIGMHALQALPLSLGRSAKNSPNDLQAD